MAYQDIFTKKIWILHFHAYISERRISYPVKRHLLDFKASKKLVENFAYVSKEWVRIYACRFAGVRRPGSTVRKMLLNVQWSFESIKIVFIS